MASDKGTYFGVDILLEEGQIVTSKPAFNDAHFLALLEGDVSEEKLPPAPPQVGAKAKAMQAYHMSKNHDWETPDELMVLLAGYGWKVVLDVCATAETQKGPEGQYLGPDHYTPQLRDALVLDWHKACKWKAREVLWMNPPYNDIDTWVAKAATEARLGARVLALLPSRTDRPWFLQGVLKEARACWFFSHRLKFVGAANVAPFPSILVEFGPGAAESQLRVKLGVISMKTPMKMDLWG